MASDKTSLGDRMKINYENRERDKGVIVCSDIRPEFSEVDMFIKSCLTKLEDEL